MLLFDICQCFYQENKIMMILDRTLITNSLSYLSIKDLIKLSTEMSEFSTHVTILFNLIVSGVIDYKLTHNDGLLLLSKLFVISNHDKNLHVVVKTGNISMINGYTRQNGKVYPLTSCRNNISKRFIYINDVSYEIEELCDKLNDCFEKIKKTNKCFNDLKIKGIVHNILRHISSRTLNIDMVEIKHNMIVFKMFGSENFINSDKPFNVTFVNLIFNSVTHYIYCRVPGEAYRHQDIFIGYFSLNNSSLVTNKIGNGSFSDEDHGTIDFCFDGVNPTNGMKDIDSMTVCEFINCYGSEFVDVITSSGEYIGFFTFHGVKFLHNQQCDIYEKYTLYYNKIMNVIEVVIELSNTVKVINNGVNGKPIHKRTYLVLKNN